MKLVSLLLTLTLMTAPSRACNITVVGCGYVGLTLAGTLLKAEHDVTCIDTNAARIEQLANRHVPLYEPHLHDALFNAPCSKTVRFSSSLRQADVYFICVPTPLDEEGKCDCSQVYAAFEHIATHHDPQRYAVICVKSTVPPGTMAALNTALKEKGFNLGLVYNPEFTREGTALHDITHNPVVLGGESHDALQKIESLYAFPLPHGPVITTNFETAELFKYAWNCFSALRITFVNELASMCKNCDADITTVIQGMVLSEQLLPTASLKPGPGYGGSCLPKDVATFATSTEKKGLAPLLVHHLIQANNNHKKRIVDDICTALPHTRRQPTVALLGLSYKAGTDDIRNSPAIDIVTALLEHNVILRVYDPQAMNNMKELFPALYYAHSSYDAIENADCMVVVTEWEEFKQLDFEKVATLCNKKIVVDTRNIFDPALLQKHGFQLINMGRRS